MIEIETVDKNDTRLQLLKSDQKDLDLYMVTIRQGLIYTDIAFQTMREAKELFDILAKRNAEDFYLDII